MSPKEAHQILLKADQQTLDTAFAAKLKEKASSDDIEENHILADACLVSLLEQLGYTKTVQAWKVVDKWYA